MKEELQEMVKDFLKDVDAHNAQRRTMEFTDFEDDVEVTFSNFIKWLFRNE